MGCCPFCSSPPGLARDANGPAGTPRGPQWHKVFGGVRSKLGRFDLKVFGGLRSKLGRFDLQVFGGLRSKLGRFDLKVFGGFCSKIGGFDLKVFGGIRSKIGRYDPRGAREVASAESPRRPGPGDKLDQGQPESRSSTCP